jgi:anti-sigma factor RsiW
MSNAQRHPDGEVLLRLADGELPGRQARKLRSHLESCWQCRTELQEMQNIVGECVRYRANVLQSLLPAPPSPWRDITYQFDEIDDSLARRSWFARFRPALTWVPVAAAVVAAMVIAYNHLHNTPAVQAAELLRKAVRAADAAPVTPKRQIRIRTKDRTVVRLASLRTSETGPLEPLSVRSYQQWRDRLPEKRDSVETADGHYAIRTSTESGDLAEATLRLRTTDLYPVQERIEFRNHDWVEIEEVGTIAPPSNDTIVSNNVHPALPLTAPVLDAPGSSSDQFRQPAPAATVGDELNVLVALHNLGADLGDPVSVKRQGGQVLVIGAGVDPARRREIEQALGSRPNVVLQFSDPDGSGSQPEKQVRGEAKPSAAALALQVRIEKQAGGRANYENLTSQALDASEAMMARVYALRRIAENFPAATDGEMTAADRQLLSDLYREHATALARQAGEIERMLKPVLAPLGGQVTPVQVAAADSWQAGTENMFTIARRVESLLAVMLGVAPGELSGRDIPTQVLSSLAQLRASADAYAPARPSDTKP